MADPPGPARAEGPPLLELSEVSVRRGQELALERVHLHVAPGTIHLLVGPNGAGKSTLLSVVLGQVPFEGLARLHARRDGRLGYVPQRFEGEATLPLTVAEFLALPRQRRPACLGLSRAMRERAEALLERVNLPGFGSRLIGELSGGELQRVLLANALDPAPELLLLDEPTSGLDAPSIARLEETLLALRRESGTTVLMVAHDLAQARRLADRVTVLQRRVLREGAPAEVLAQGLEGVG
jgi:zinc transport system ATP-binding protein